ncbi:MAG: glycogen synthase [Vicinamibacterales bacterium]|nr:glycogen synthase [Vicinamibacterales bacterium]
MPPRLKILYLASEAAPFTKTGGLADVTGSLPKAMAALGHDVRLVLPAYAPIEARARELGSDIRVSDLTLRVPVRDGHVRAGLFESFLPGSYVPVSFVAEREVLARPDVYGYHDDPYRFAFFSRAALDAEIAAKGWRPDVVHAHDWHAAPAVWWLATAGNADERYRAIPTVFTVHNLMHQGHAPWDLVDYLGILTHGLTEEPYGGVNLMARGIYHATMVSTVSPTYAREVMTREGGHGLDGLLRHRRADLHGVLNGLDHDVWNPAADPHLARRFDAQTLDERIENKRELQRRLGLPVRDDVPLVGMVTRLDWQKGLDVLGHVLHLLMSGEAGEAQFALLGSGSAHYEDMVRHIVGYHREKAAAVLRYDADLAPLVYGGADAFLMPSLFEPCGLAQLIAMRYGAVPVVRATGGLADTVRDGVTGFTYHQQDVESCWGTVCRALHVWRNDRGSWRAMQRNGMAFDSSWITSAHAYQQIYGWAIARMQGW